MTQKVLEIDVTVYNSVNKCGWTFNNIDDPYARICVPDKVKHMDVKVFNLKSRVNVSINVDWTKVYLI